MLRWDIVMSVLTEYDSDSFLGIAYDGYGEQKSGIHPAEVHWHGGVFCRPRDPEVDGKGNVKIGANVLHAWEGNVGHVFPLSDPRAVQKLPELKKGGAGIYGDTGKEQLPFWMYDGDTGTATCYIPYKFINGVPQKAMLLAFNVDDDDTASIALVHGEGMAITMTAGAKNSMVLKNKAGDAYLEVNDDGHIINGNTVINGGATIGSPAGALPAAIAPKLLAYLTALETDIATAMTAIGAGTAAAGALGATSFTGTAAARATLSAQIAALKTSIA